MNSKRLAVLSALCLTIVVGLMLFSGSTAHAASTWYVSQTGTPTGTSGGSCTNPSFNTISAAITAASSGDTIQVCSGTYDEQVNVMTPNLTITGAGAGSTTIKPSAVAPNSSSLYSGQPIYAIVLVDNVRGVTVENLTVDGEDAAAPLACNTYVGIFYRGASGTISNTRVTNIFFPAWRGCQGYLGIFVQSGHGGSGLKANVTIDSNTVDNYGKNGITANEGGTQVTVTNNIVTGRDHTTYGDAAQNGVQIGFGARGTVTDNTIKDHWYDPPEWVACGILFNGAGGLNTTKNGANTFLNNEVNICTAGNGPSSNSPFNQ